MDIRSCFILMPFSQTNTLKKADLDFIYTDILKRAIEEYEVDGKKYFERVERFNSKVGSIIEGIVNSLNSAELVIADLTGLNPNVMYELGVRHSLKRGTIMISQDVNKLPSDLRDYITVDYCYSPNSVEQSGYYQIFKTSLHKSIDELRTTHKYDSPVLNYLQQKQVFRQEEEIEKLKTNAVIVNAIYDEWLEIQDALKALKENNFRQDFALAIELVILKFSNFLSALNELDIPYDSSILYENIRNSRTLLAEIIRGFRVVKPAQLPSTGMGLQLKWEINPLQECIERKFVNPFAIIEEKGLEYISIDKLFKDDGILEEELLDYLEKYIEDKRVELGVNQDEIKRMFST